MVRNRNRRVDFSFAPRHIQTCIGLVNDRHKTIVCEDGSLNYGFNGDPSVEMNYASRVTGIALPVPRNAFFTYRVKPLFCHRDIFLRREQDHSEIAKEIFVTTTEFYETTVFRWTIFAYAEEGLRADVIRWRLSALPGFGRAPSHVGLSIDGPKDGRIRTIESPGTTAFWTPNGDRHPSMIDLYQFLLEGQTWEGAFAIPLEGDMAPQSLTLAWAEKAEEQMRDYWRNVNPFARAFHIPDRSIADMLDACGRNILQAREEREGTLQFQVGPTLYRSFWIIDAYFILEAVQYMGRGTEDRHYGIPPILRHAQTNGQIQIIPGHTKETAVAIALLIRQGELLSDDDFIRELWPVIMKGLGFIHSLRDQAHRMGSEYPAHELFPPGFLDGGIAGPFPEYNTPLWVLYACKIAYRTGERLGLDGYLEFKATFDAVMAETRRCIARDTRVTAKGIPYFPMNMTPRDFDKPQSATWALAHSIYPGEVFSKHDPIVCNFLDLLDSIDDTEGLPEETGWIHDQGLWPYAGIFDAHAWLYAGKPDKAVDYLYAFANHAAPSRVWREEQPLRDSHSNEYCGDMPHNWASAEFIRMVRNLLVLEKENGLELLPGLPEEWLPKANTDLFLEKTPTRFGLVTLHMQFLRPRTFAFIFSRQSGTVGIEQIRLYWSGSIVAKEGMLQKAGEGAWLLPIDTTEVSIELSVEAQQ